MASFPSIELHQHDPTVKMSLGYYCWDHDRPSWGAPPTLPPTLPPTRPDYGSSRIKVGAFTPLVRNNYYCSRPEVHLHLPRHDSIMPTSKSEKLASIWPMINSRFRRLFAFVPMFFLYYFKACVCSVRVLICFC